MGPLYKFGWFDFAYSLQLAGLTGFLFGFVLERAGFGSPRKLTAIFYLRDFAVLKVMFTAIVVCVLGLLYFTLFGWIDPSRIYVLPTYLWPQIVGGFLLGVGFVVGGYCPTTSVVATVTGKLDALVFIVGMVLGSLVFAELFPALQGFYEAGSMGVVRLSDLLGVHSGIVALLVCLMAVGAYWVAEKVENRFGDPETLPGGSRKAKLTAAAVLAALGLVLAFANPEQAARERKAQARAVPKVEEAAAPLPAPAASEGFKIVDDEGC